MSDGEKKDQPNQVSTPPAIIETNEDKEEESSVEEEERSNLQNKPGGVKYSIEFLKQKYQDRINLTRRGGRRRRLKTKEDLKTREQVLDRRTEYILYQLLNNGEFDQVNGCISTGKEGNVYHATNVEKEDLAIKIYKTTALSFKDREKYIKGEHRWVNGYGGSNTRKMIKLWAEKEFRNLKRLEAAEIPCPCPRVVRENVLVMDHIGKDGQAAPRLKDTKLSRSRLGDVYVQMMVNMRVMYQECNLVHGDLSEYNVLYLDKVLYFIDVSQSVESDHPESMEFLRMDCKNVNDYFKRHGVSVCTDMELFEFIIDPNIRRKKVEKRIQRMNEIVQERILNETEVDDTEVQANLDGYMRTTLHELDENDMFSTNLARARNLSVQRLTRFEEDKEVKVVEEEESSSSEEEDPYSDLEDEPEEPEQKAEVHIMSPEKSKHKNMINYSLEGVDLSTVQNVKKRLTKKELKEIRKANKVLIKEENRERRKTRKPKKVKKTRKKRIKKKQGRK